MPEKGSDLLEPRGAGAVMLCPPGNCPIMGCIFHQRSAPSLAYGLFGSEDRPWPPWMLVSFMKAYLACPSLLSLCSRYLVDALRKVHER